MERDEISKYLFRDAAVRNFKQPPNSDCEEVTLPCPWRFEIFFELLVGAVGVGLKMMHLDPLDLQRNCLKIGDRKNSPPIEMKNSLPIETKKAPPILGD